MTLLLMIFLFGKLRISVLVFCGGLTTAEIHTPEKLRLLSVL
jgi:hypothetical protein